MGFKKSGRTAFSHRFVYLLDRSFLHNILEQEMLLVANCERRAEGRTGI